MALFLQNLTGLPVIIAIEKEYNLPVVFVGVGEGVNDLEKFDYEDFIDNLF